MDKENTDRGSSIIPFFLLFMLFLFDGTKKCAENHQEASSGCAVWFLNYEVIDNLLLKWIVKKTKQKKTSER